MAVSEIKLREKALESSSKEDLDKLLKLAEELEEKIDNANKYVEGFRNKFLISIGLGMLTCVFLYIAPLAFFPKVSNINLQIAVFFVNLCFYIILAIAGIHRILKLRKAILPDKRALKEVLQLLRETFAAISDKENWSVLSRAEFRIRLSRFNIEAFDKW